MTSFLIVGAEMTTGLIEKKAPPSFTPVLDIDDDSAVVLLVLLVDVVPVATTLVSAVLEVLAFLILAFLDKKIRFVVLFGVFVFGRLTLLSLSLIVVRICVARALGLLFLDNYVLATLVLHLIEDRFAMNLGLFDWLVPCSPAVFALAVLVV